MMQRPVRVATTSILEASRRNVVLGLSSRSPQLESACLRKACDAAIVSRRHATSGTGGASSSDASATGEAEKVAVKVVHPSKRSVWPYVGIAGALSAAGVAWYFRNASEKSKGQPESVPQAAKTPSAAEVAAKEEKAAAERRLAEEKAAESRRIAEEKAREQAALERRLAEEKAEAERLAAEAAAAAAARVQALRDGVSAALAEVVAPGASLEAVESLRAALDAAQAEDVSEDSSIADAKTRLAELEDIANIRSKLGASVGALEESMLSHATEDCRGALASIAEAEAALVALGEMDKADADLVTRGRDALVEMERLDMEAARCAASQKALQAAVLTRQPEPCREAVAEARSAGLAPCPLLTLAEVLSEPESLHQMLARDGADSILQRRLNASVEGREGDLEVEDFVAAATASASVLTKEELRQRAAELAKALVQTHALRAREVDDELGILEARLREKQEVRVNEALTRFKAEQQHEREEKEALLREVWEERTKEATALALAEVAAEADKRMQKLCEEVNADRDARIAHETDEFARRYSALQEPLDTVSRLIGQGMSLQQRSQASSLITGALMALQGALIDGRESHAELQALQALGSSADAFVAKLLHLLPVEVVESSKKPVPTAFQLSRTFQDQLSSFSAAAFVLPVKGLFSEFLSRFTSRVFSFLYVLKSEEVPAAGDPEVRRNLEVLAKAAKFVERGELREALALMEASLTGECRSRASGWMRETRHALLLHQAAQALQAKARCLNAVLY